MLHLRILALLLVFTLAPASDAAAQALVAITPDPIAFGRVFVDTCRTIMVTVRNDSTATLIVDAFDLGGDSASFGITAPSFDTLSEGETITVSLRFCPTDTLPHTARLTVHARLDSGMPYDTGVDLTGQGRPRYSLLPADTLLFDPTAPGSTTQDSIAITNHLPYPVDVDATMLSVAQPFELVDPTTRSIPRDSTLALRIRFRPVSLGTYRAGTAIRIGATIDTVRLIGPSVSAYVTHTSPTLDFRLRRVDKPPADLADTMVNEGDAIVVVESATLLGRSTQFAVDVGFDTSGIGIWRYVTLDDTAGFFPVRLGRGDRFATRVRFAPTVADTLCVSDIVVLRTTIGDISIPVSGCAGVAVASLSPTEIDFGDVPIDSCRVLPVVITNTGNVTLTLGSRIISTTGAFAILDTMPGSDDAITLLSKQLAPGESIAVRIRFCPVDKGPDAGVDTLMHDAVIGPDRVVLRGNGVDVTAVVWGAPAAVDIGAVDVGAFIDTVVTVTNRTPVPATIERVELASGAAALGFTLVAPPPQPGTVVPPGASFDIRVRFAPVGADPAQTSLEIDPGTPRALSVALTGRGRPLAEELLAWIDSTAGRVGTPIALRVRLDRAIDPVRERRVASVRVAFDPRSFFPISGEDWSIESRSTGVATFVRTDVGVISGSELATIMLRPLSTARPLDTVRLTAVSVEGERISIAGSFGIVELEGCDIGRDPGLARPLRIDAVGGASVDGHVAIEYEAPAGTQPYARVVDRSGTMLGTIAMPVGAGAPQRFELDLRDFAPGMLIVEIRLADQRVTIPIMHRR